jgi:glycosyltransferase involved in cell wall biosynthesis
MMRVALISPFQLRLGRGIERFHWALGTALARRGVEVEIWCWDVPHPFDWGALPDGVRLRRVPNVRYFMARWAALWYRRWLRAGYDQVVIAFAGYGEGAALRSYAGASTLVLHYPREHVLHRYAEFVSMGVAARAQTVIAPSAFVAESAAGLFAHDPIVIPNGVDPAAFTPDPAVRASVRAEYGIAPDAPVFITLAALEMRKGVSFAVRAMPEVLRAFPNAQYWVLGEGKDRAALEGEIAAHDLGAHVRLFGVRPDVTRYLNAADVSVLLASGEAFGITLVESMAMHLPIIAANRAPFPEIVTPDVGILVDENDPRAVAAALIALASDPARRAALGARGRAAAESRYRWDTIAGMYLAAWGR